MVKHCYRLLLLLFIPAFVLSQHNNFRTDTGFVENSTRMLYSEDDVRLYILNSADSLNSILIGGNISSIFHEQIDSVWIIYKVEKLTTDSVFSKDGLFQLPAKDLKKNRLVEIRFKHPEYHLLDTSIVLNTSEPVILLIKLMPKYKISLRGRVFAGNLPLQGVKVQIQLKDKSFLLETRGCFYDSENYWNCLYDGMFKQDLIIENISDSINLRFERSGMKPLSTGMILTDYTGEIINFKMKYDSKLSVRPKNCLSLKIAFPLLTLENNWFVDLAYYRTLSKKFFDRVSIGLDANILLSPVSVSGATFQNNAASFDTSYISGYIGPSVLFWLIKPESRYFSTYAGLTAGIGFDDGDFFIQPFIGTRIFIDFNKAISFELRHVPYDLDMVHYTFNPYGNAYRHFEVTEFKDYLLDIGIQIAF